MRMKNDSIARRQFVSNVWFVVILIGGMAGIAIALANILASSGCLM